MPSQYNLKIKATLDTSQVRQELQNLRLPGNGGGGGGGGGSGGGGASAEIENAAKKVNLGALHRGLSRLSRSLEEHADRIAGVQGKYIRSLADTLSYASNAISNIKAFGPAMGSLISAMQVYTEATAMLSDKQKAAADAIMDISNHNLAERTKNVDAHRQEEIKTMSVEQLRSALADANSRVDSLTRRKATAESEVHMASETVTANTRAVGAGAGDWARRHIILAETLGIGDELASSKRLLDSAKAEWQEVDTELKREIQIRDEYAAALARATEAQETEVAAQEEATETFLENAEAIHNAGETLKADRAEEVRIRGIAESGDMSAMRTEFNKVGETIARLEGQFTLSEHEQGQLKDAYRMQDFWKGEMDREQERRDSQVESQNSFFESRDFRSQLGVYADQAGNLSDKQRDSMERRRKKLESENEELRRQSEAGEVIDLNKFQENARRISDITGVLDKDSAKKKELPAWLDGVEERTDDWFHSIGGSIGGEGNIQNDEYRVLQEIERLMRESTGYARQTAQSVA